MDISCWGSTGKSLSIINFGNVINIYDVPKNTLLKKIPLSFHLSTEYSCMCEGRPSFSIEKTKENVKKRKVSKNVEYLCCGSSKGHLFSFKNTGEFIKEIDTGYGKDILCVSFVQPNSIMFAVKPNNLHIVSNVFLPNVVSSISSNIGPELNLSSGDEISSFCLSGNLVVVSMEGKINIYNRNTKKLVKSFQSHQVGSNLLELTNDRFLVAGSSQDRYIYVFDLSTGSHKTLSVQTHPRQISVWFVKNSTLHLGVTSQTGHCFLWNVNEDVEDYSTKIIAFVDSGKKRRVPILGSYLQQNNKIVLVTGTEYNPKFSSVKYVDDDKGLFIKEMFLKLHKEQLKRVDIEEAERKDFVTLREGNMNSSLARYHSTFRKENDLKEESKIIEELITIDRKKKKDETVLLEISSTLFDSLKYNDETMVESILDQVDDTRLISGTVKELSSTLAIDLLKFIITQFLDLQKNHAKLTEWLRALILHHAHTIVGNEEILKKLGPLYNSVTSRSQDFQLLLDVSGRLDLLLSLGGYDQVGFGIETIADEQDDDDDEEDDDDVVMEDKNTVERIEITDSNLTEINITNKGVITEQDFKSNVLGKSEDEDIQNEEVEQDDVSQFNPFSKLDEDDDSEGEMQEDEMDVDDE